MVTMLLPGPNIFAFLVRSSLLELRYSKQTQSLALKSRFILILIKRPSAEISNIKPQEVPRIDIWIAA
jgi:hypothetical protein